MDNRRIYKNPPIEQAICEFRFEPGMEWNLIIPGKLHIALSEAYPNARQQTVVEFGVEVRDGKPSELRHGEGLGNVQLVNQDDNRTVDVGVDFLSISMMRPYQNPDNPDKSGWDEFKYRIKNALHEYWGVAQPRGVKRIGVRYINKIVVPNNTANVTEYLKCIFPDLSELSGLSGQVNGYVSRTEFSYEDGVGLILSQGKLPNPANASEFILDIDVVWRSESVIGQSEALRKVEDLRDRERVAFESSITDEARGLFDDD